jgi:hypothetical protein
MTALNEARGERIRGRPWSLPPFGDRQQAKVVLVTAAAAVAVGVLLTRSPLVAAVSVAAVAVSAGIVRFGRLAPAQLALASLPWLVVFDAQIPPLLRTFTTTAAAIAVLALVAPLRYERLTVCLGAFTFVTLVLGNAVVATQAEELIQAAKYLIFPAMALAVVSLGGREQLPHTRKVLLGSGLAAMGAHLTIVAVGLGETGSYYDIGERLGFAYEIPQEVGLMGVTVGAAGLVAARRMSAQVAFFALGALPAVLTGVRAGLLAALVVLVAFLLRSRLNARALTILAGVVCLFFVTGAVDTVATRFAKEAGTFSSVETAGSGRGAIYQVALENWAESGPRGWVVGTGLLSIPGFELEDLGVALIGHSDFIEVSVQLGLVGLLAWLLIWFALLRAGLQTVILMPIAVYAVVTGSLAYVASLTVGLTLAAAWSEEPTREELAASGGRG